MKTQYLRGEKGLISEDSAEHIFAVFSHYKNIPIEISSW